jgi:flavorubredoxin
MIAVCPLRLWPQKRWKKMVLVTFLTLIVAGAISITYVLFSINKDVVSPIDVINSEGGKTALVVYQPGLSSFPKDVSYAFGNGLASNGWRVEITTASSQTPSDLSKYKLLVLGFPAYGGSPGTAIVRYIDRLANLNGINTIIIACAGGSTGTSVDTMKQKVQAAGGTFKESITLFTMAPNKGNGTATDIARRAGTQIQP